MIYLLHNFDFSFDTLPSIWLKQFKFLIYLYSYLLIQKLMKSNTNHSIRSLAYSFSNYIVIYVFDRAELCAELVYLT